jgi:mRNA-degrading endonuclease RelE of RelBE toxin-antitoxin system
MSPPGLVDFIHESGFDDDWEDCSLSVETDLWDLQVALSALPESGSVIPGSGGLRKLRWKGPGSGKRGGVRVIYLWIPEIFIIYLFMVYPKSEIDSISAKALKLIRLEAEQARERLIEVYGTD